MTATQREEAAGLITASIVPSEPDRRQIQVGLRNAMPRFMPGCEPNIRILPIVGGSNMLKSSAISTGQTAIDALK